MNDLLWLIALIASNVILGFSIYFINKQHYKEKEEIFNRYMARNLADYEFHKQEYPEIIKQKDKDADVKREKEKEMNKGQYQAKTAAKQF